MKKIQSFLYVLMILPVISMAQINGLSGWDIFVDPGHSRNENMPSFSWAISEAKRNLGVALHLRDMLLNETDIDTVFLSRYNSEVKVSLSDRTRKANSLGASWYHSIHSDAGGAGSNTTLLLWGQKQNGSEKVPNGGKAMSDIMIRHLTDGMRTTTAYGSIGDCSFYNCSFSGPYLHVNRESTMPSELSEAGFHTNPRQNQLFMNSDWQKLEARTFFWSILDYHKIERPKVHILAGEVLDTESGIPLNGASITVQGRKYITDTFESLFNKYTNEPDLLHNGFYYLEDIPADSVKVIAEADGYKTDSAWVVMKDDFFTFKDFKLISEVAPYVSSVTPAAGDSAFSILDDIVINFSRPMQRNTVESEFSIEPAASGVFKWNYNDTQLTFKTDSLHFDTEYTITISAEALGQFGHAFDGNGDGQTGDAFSVHFKTGHDVYPPEICAVFPGMNKSSIELQPVISIQFDEEIDSTSVRDDVFKLERFKDKSAAGGELHYYTVDERSVLNFFPQEKLSADAIYTTRLYPGIRDRYGNEISKYTSVSFTTTKLDWDIRVVDNLEQDFVKYWWQPSQSGSTTGTRSIPGIYREADTLFTNKLSGSMVSMKLFYDWDLNAESWLIREYLSGGSARSVEFDSTYTLQCYVFGDGSGTLFRFALDEGNAKSWPNHEVSKWYEIDWIGWKRVSWDLKDKNETGTWGGLGNGILDQNRYRFDSFQLSYQAGAAENGTIYIDDLQLIKEIPVTAIFSGGENNTPAAYRLNQNFPNPFNPVTEIEFTLSKSSETKLSVYDMLGRQVAVVTDQYLNAGTYRFRFSSGKLASGIYIYELKADDVIIRKKMQLLK